MCSFARILPHTSTFRVVCADGQTDKWTDRPQLRLALLNTRLLSSNCTKCKKKDDKKKKHHATESVIQSRSQEM